VVVIALIVLLAALVLGVGTAVVKGSETRQTTLLLAQLDTAAKEWRAQSDRDVAYGPGVPPYELNQVPLNDDDATAEALTLEYFAILERVNAVREALATVNGDLVTRIDVGDPPVPRLRFVDAWDAPIVVVLPGRPWVQGSDLPALRDADATILTPLEARLGSARNRQAYFVSRGPDGQLGDVATDVAHTQDNLSSQTVTP
jgi:type II secretory pathway pseudopilin PulG